VTESRAIRVLIVDDQPIVRRGLRAFLLAFEALELVGEAASGQEAIEMSRGLAPDVILMDLVMPQVDGVAATRTIHQRDPRIRVVALTNFADDELIHRALDAGASGYLLKDVTAEDLYAAIVAAKAGRSVLAPEVTRRLAETAARPFSPGPRLSEREREVLALMVRGRSNRAIADQLVISRSTVKYHVGSIFRKLGVVTRTEAVAHAVQHHLVEGAG
jgi:two-component system, NarL family, response regulator LiaR